MNKEDFDRVFDAAFEEAARNHLPSPDPDPSWSKIETILKERHAKRKFRPLPYAVAASFLIGAFILGSPTVTKAFNPFVQTIKNIQAGVVSFIFGNDTEQEGQAKTAPPPDSVTANEGRIIDNGVLAEKNYKSWEEAAKTVAFTAPAIGYIPDRFQLNDVILFYKDELEKAKKAVLLYTNQVEAKSFMLTIRMLEQNETVTTGTDANAGDYETVEVHGQPGYLFTTKDGRASLDYMSGNTLVSIAGSLTKDEIMQVANNIK